MATPTTDDARPDSLRFFDFEGRRLAYEVHGHADRIVVLTHGLLMDRHMNRAVARDLAGRGYQVVLLDFLGHGGSDKPPHASEYRTDAYARQVLALLDHLGVEAAVLGGVSLGANVSLLAAARRPDRVLGLVLEMPVLEHAVPAAAMTFVPLLLAARYTGWVAQQVAGMFRRAPRTGTAADSVLNALSLEPSVVAAVLHGLLIGPLASTLDERRATAVPALVIGHTWDLIHPFDDAENLADQLPNARLVRAHWPFELRMRPHRLSGEIAEFLDAVWPTKASERAASAAGGPRPPSVRRPRSGRAARARRIGGAGPAPAAQAGEPAPG
jgi:pimeloyl-ACP methyl ester carboxylesterase